MLGNVRALGSPIDSDYAKMVFNGFAAYHYIRMPNSWEHAYECAVIIFGLVTFIAAYHYIRMVNSWEIADEGAVISSGLVTRIAA